MLLPYLYVHHVKNESGVKKYHRRLRLEINKAGPERENKNFTSFIEFSSPVKSEHYDSPVNGMSDLCLRNEEISPKDKHSMSTEIVWLCFFRGKLLNQFSKRF